MQGLIWSLCALLCLSLWEESHCRSSRDTRRAKEPSLLRTKRAPQDPDAKKCSYTFLVPEQRITGPICASTTGPEPDKDRVTRMDISDVREVLNKQRREIETLQLVVEVDGNLVNEMKLLRKESRNMNSRVTQLYMQLLHEIIRKRDNSLELVQLENRVLNVTSEMIRLASRYKELEARFATMAGVVNNQSILISALEEQCLRMLGRSELPPVPPLVQVVPENIPVDNRFTNEIVTKNRGFSRGSRRESPTGSPFGMDPPPPQGTLTSDGPFKDCYQVRQAGYTTSGKKVYAEYSSFHLESESEGYKLRLGTYQGNAGDSLSSNNGKAFTTLDRDKDAFSGNCAHYHKGGWWYNACGQTNLNGVWYSGGVYRSKFQDGIFWADYGGGFYSLKCVRLMIRPID
uniref:Angiopoietin-like 1 n=1 Tax=Iconisemion striatum TaxID=60296 RepID=A0A1A7WXI9_9TELE